MRRVRPATLALAAAVFVINRLIEANYLYLAGLGTALILACYAPRAVLDRRSRRRAAQAPPAAGR